MPQNLQDTVIYQTIWNLAVQLAGRTTDNVPQKESDMVQGVLASQLEDLWRKEAWPELSDNWFQPTLNNNAFPNPYQIDLTVTVAGAGDSQANGTYTTTDGVNYSNSSGSTLVGSSGVWTISTRSLARYTLTSTTPIGISWSVLSGATAPAPTSSSWTNPAALIGDILGVYNVDPRTVEGWERVPQDKIVDGNDQFYINTCWTQPWVNYQLPCPDLLDPSLVGVANQAALNAVTLPRRFRNPLAFIGASALLAAEDAAMAAKYSNLAQVKLIKQASLLRPKWWGIETGKR